MDRQYQTPKLIYKENNYLLQLINDNKKPLVVS